MGRRHGTSFFKHGWRRRLLPPEAMKAMRKAYQNYGTLGIFVSRFLPGVRSAVKPFAGVAGLSPTRAVLPTAVASALWYALLIAAGTLLGNQWSEVRKLVERVTGVLTLVGVLGAIGFFVWLRRRKRGGASS